MSRRGVLQPPAETEAIPLRPGHHRLCQLSAIRPCSRLIPWRQGPRSRPEGSPVGVTGFYGSMIWINFPALSECERPDRLVAAAKGAPIVRRHSANRLSDRLATTIAKMLYTIPCTVPRSRRSVAACLSKRGSISALTAAASMVPEVSRSRR